MLWLPDFRSIPLESDPTGTASGDRLIYAHLRLQLCNGHYAGGGDLSYPGVFQAEFLVQHTEEYRDIVSGFLRHRGGGGRRLQALTLPSPTPCWHDDETLQEAIVWALVEFHPTTLASLKGGLDGSAGVSVHFADIGTLKTPRDYSDIGYSLDYACDATDLTARLSPTLTGDSAISRASDPPRRGCK